MMVAAKSLMSRARGSQIGPKRCTGSLMMEGVEIVTTQNYYERARSRLGPGLMHLKCDSGGGGPP